LSRGNTQKKKRAIGRSKNEQTRSEEVIHGESLMTAIVVPARKESWVGKIQSDGKGGTKERGASWSHFGGFGPALGENDLWSPPES